MGKALFKQKLKGDLVAPMIRTFIARGIAAVGGLLLIVVLGRLHGPAGVGVFALAQSIYLGAGILARYGMDNALMRYVGQDHTSCTVTLYLRWALTKTALLSLAAAAVVYLFRHLLAQWFDTPELAHLLAGVSLAIPSFTLAFVLGGFMKGIRKPATACLLENGSISLIASFFVVLLAYTWPQLGIAAAGWAMAMAAWLILGQGIWQTWRWIAQQNWISDETPISARRFASTSQAFFVLSLARLMQQVIGVMIAGWLLNSADLGLFRSAERAAFLITFILLVINAVFPPRFATLYHKGDLAGLSRLARKGAVLGILLALPILLICLLVPHWLLGLFGTEFVPAANLLRIIALAQLINVATGSVGLLLNMTGHEVLMRNIALSCNVLGLLLFFLLIFLLGTLGAALALAIVLVLQNLIALVFVWRKLGIWILPVPNFLKWIPPDLKDT